MPNLEPKVTMSQVLWGDVCQVVDPDPGTPYPIYTFGGRIQKYDPNSKLSAPLSLPYQQP